MSVLTIGNAISSIRNQMKANKIDTFLTDYEIYCLYKKHTAPIMKRLDEKGHLIKFASVFETLDYVELEECDRVEACCAPVKSGLTFKKTKLPMPMFTEGYFGPMVNSITSLDGSVIFKLIRNADIYNMMSKTKDFKYNKWKYCWYLNDRLYFVDTNYPAVRIEGLFEEDISMFKCGEDKCLPRQEQSLNIPDFIREEVENNVIKALLQQLQVPSDKLNDNQSPLR